LIQKNKLSGIILTGGKSNRMGKDKAFIKYKNKRFIEVAIDLINPFCSEILISGSTDKYSDIGYKVVEDKYLDCGPVSGIYSCLTESANDYCLILPVDMPFISSELISHIIKNAHNSKISAVILPNGHIEPLCAIYPKSIASEIKIHIENGDFKLINILKNLSFKTILINESLDFYNKMLFANINTPADKAQFD